jgi:homoserine kinase
MRVRVAVPASVANLGPGFDILAMALQLQNDVRAEQRLGPLTIDAGPDAPEELNDPKRNLVTTAYAQSCAALGVPATGVHFTCVNRIPIGRGMGSSAAATLSGVLVATALHQAPWDEDDVLERVAALEGHRDNAAAALLGGLAICAPDAQAVQMAVSDDLRAVLFIPDLPFTTTESRRVVPTTFSRADAIFNAGRCALLVRALALGDHAALRVAMQDRWHQDARFALIQGSREIVAAAGGAGASGAALAGAGPSVIALTPLDPEPIAVAMAAAASSAGVSGATMVLAPRNYGTRVDVSQ